MSAASQTPAGVVIRTSVSVTAAAAAAEAPVAAATPAAIESAVNSRRESVFGSSDISDPSLNLMCCMICENRIDGECRLYHPDLEARGSRLKCGTDGGRGDENDETCAGIDAGRRDRGGRNFPGLRHRWIRT